MPPEDPSPSAHHRDFVQALAKGLMVLRAFEQGELLGNRELVTRTGLPKATVSRLTGTLQSLGYLKLDPISRKYLLVAQWLGLTASAQRHRALQQRLRPLMDRLARELDATVILATREHTHMVFLEMSRPVRSLLTVNTVPGSVVPMTSTAIGLAYLVGAPAGERASLLRDLQVEHHEPWLRDRPGIEQAHLDHARFGFVMSQRSRGGAVSGVAVPLPIPPHGHLALGCAGPSSELPRHRLMERFGPRLLEVAAEMQNLTQEGFEIGG